MNWYEWVIPAIMIAMLGATPILSVWALQKFLNDRDKDKDNKKRKALEIIKEKNVDIQYIKDKDCSLEMYNRMVLLKEWQLTKKEYYLLKEILL